MARLIDWNVEVLLRFLKLIAAKATIETAPSA
jgi:hypothetical protein